MKHFSIEVNEKMYEAICSIFTELNLSVPQKITSHEMQKVLSFLKYKIRKVETITNASHNKKVNFAAGKINKTQTIPIKKLQQKPNNVLVVSRLGIIRYQLKVLLNNKKYDVSITDNMYMGMAEYIKRLPAIVILDMGEDDEKDTLDLVNRIDLWSEKNHVKPIIITLSSRIDYILKQKCLNKGVDRFVFKKDNWHAEFMTIINEVSEEKKLSILENVDTSSFYSYATT